jgi:cytochrome c
MKSIIVSMIAVAGLMVAGSALAIDMPELAKKSGCTVCHTIEKKLVGPAWRDIAKAYNSNGATTTGKKVADILAEHKATTAGEWLEQKIAKGGTGNWGAVPMTANAPKVSAANIHELVEFILGLEKK